MQEFDNKLKFTALGIISLVLYVINLVSNMLINYSTYGLGRSLFTFLITVLMIIPSYEFMCKAYAEQRYNKEYKISVYAKVGTVLLIGTPLLTYGMYSWIFNKTFIADGKLKGNALVAWIVLCIITLGFVFFAVAISEFVIKRSLKDIIELPQPELTTVSIVFLVLISIPSFGIIWFPIYIGSVLMEWIFKRIARVFFDNEIKLRTSTIIWLVIFSIITFGIFWLILLATYGIYEAYLIIYKNIIEHNLSDKEALV